MTYTLNTNDNTIDTITITGSDYSASTVTLGGGPYNWNTGITSSVTTAWATPSKFTNGSGSPVMTIPADGNRVVLEDKAELEVKGKVKINGQDLEERLERIETLLHIPTRDVTMENKYPKLKQLFEQYMKELEKYKTWDRLNGDENETT